MRLFSKRNLPREGGRGQGFHVEATTCAMVIWPNCVVHSRTDREVRERNKASLERRAGPDHGHRRLMKEGQAHTVKMKTIKSVNLLPIHRIVWLCFPLEVGAQPWEASHCGYIWVIHLCCCLFTKYTCLIFFSSNWAVVSVDLSISRSQY